MQSSFLDRASWPKSGKVVVPMNKENSYSGVPEAGMARVFYTTDLA